MDEAMHSKDSKRRDLLHHPPLKGRVASPSAKETKHGTSRFAVSVAFICCQSLAALVSLLVSSSVFICLGLVLRCCRCRVMLRVAAPCVVLSCQQNVAGC